MFNHELDFPLKSLSLDQKIISVPKGTTLQRVGDKNIKFYYVLRGLLRSYIIDHKDKEHTFMFAPEEWLVGDSVAYSSKQESQLFIDTLEDSKIVVYNPSLLNENESLTSIEYTTEINRLVKRIGVLQDRILMQMGSPALVRYQHFVGAYPQIIERVPLKMIATYLGITPEALSKVRSDWAKLP